MRKTPQSRPRIAINLPQPFVSGGGTWREENEGVRITPSGFMVEKHEPLAIRTPATTFLSADTPPDVTLLDAVPAENLEFAQLLASGHFGDVHLAVDKISQKQFAAKLMYLTDQEKERQEQAREIRALYAANSDYVVKFENAFLRAGRVCIIMEYMDAGSLDKILQNVGGPLPEPIIAKIAYAMIQGIRDLERRNIVNRDIKPENVLMNSRGEIKLCDLGVSGVLERNAVESYMGTEVYFSPERILGDPYGVAADVWATAVTLLYLAYGHYPYEALSGKAALSVFDLTKAIVYGPQPVPPPGASADFVDFIRVCLDKVPERRAIPYELLGSLDPRERDSAPGYGHPFLQFGVVNRVDMAFWVKSVMEGQRGCMIERAATDMDDFSTESDEFYDEFDPAGLPPDGDDADIPPMDEATTVPIAPMPTPFAGLAGPVSFASRALAVPAAFPIDDHVVSPDGVGCSPMDA